MGTANIFGQIYLMNTNLQNYQARMTNPREHFFYWFWCDLVAGSYFMLAVVGLGACAICLAFERIRTARRLAQAESDRLRWELEAVKHRTNPHFIFNALNSIYYSIEAHNQPARMLTETFASLLRHQLYDCNEATVRIEQELRCIEAYVSLQQQRAGPAVQVHCRGLDAAGGFSIPPHLLMPLVENCFKHVSRHADRPNTIHLHAAVTDNRFVFLTRNTCTPAVNGDANGNGIGLALVRRQLELLGMNGAALTTARHDADFETSLTLALS
jgi:LytS/YehU family sensor histidine kinase